MTINWSLNPQGLIKFSDYPEKFTVPYMELVYGAVSHDRELVYEKSVELGFLTGAESQKMKDAHVDSVMIVGEPYQVTIFYKILEFSTSNFSRIRTIFTKTI